VNRAAGQVGRCGAGSRVTLFRYGPHDGEEPPVSGSRGSGTVFFSRCTLGCLYCQNYPWSQEGRGSEYSVGELAEVFLDLRRQGCHNWNLVSPTPWLPMIEEALETAKQDGPCLPVVYNTSGFERIEILRRTGRWVDVYLADLRYAWSDTAAQASGHAGYAEAARAALLEMWRLAGPLEVDAEGIAVSGTVCRMLILPNRADEAVANLEWLASAVGTEIAVSVMAQYVPAYRAARTPSWDRPISRAEYDTVCDAVERLGFETGWIQDFGQPPARDLAGFEMSEKERL